ncbi:hypothetical protein QWY86_18980 [Pedobacter aquatilis]|uniref:hypothetical protein n=1 Tax=Pedobacter aquatilis TaxID=351343 RepID=UPI0025B61AA9|nr:hypothetical protein [Pedobacter aquatilis]MDN3588774.1 hypothetical protein [Pedobacter aquatilis]
MVNPKNDSAKNEPNDGLDKWNNRLEENLEQPNHNDTSADENAKEFSEKFKNKSQDDE